MHAKRGKPARKSPVNGGEPKDENPKREPQRQSIRVVFSTRVSRQDIRRVMAGVSDQPVSGSICPGYVLFMVPSRDFWRIRDNLAKIAKVTLPEGLRERATSAA